MRIRIPTMKVCQKFHLTYELKGAEKAVKVLTEFYGIRRMKIIVDGRRVMRACEADYFEGIACFTKKGLNRRNVLHELYHHIIEAKGIKMPQMKEERMASLFVREVIRKV